MWRTLGRVFELALFSAIILLTRCANYADVFVGGQIYFLDPDCYARLTRARMVFEHPGLVVRRHQFENFPAGISPHTTAPLDYLIAGLAGCLRPLTAQPLDLAGAIVSPLLALIGGWFLFWWTRGWPWPGRYLALLTYGLSAILVHGTALGRPDHQAALVVALMIALAAEWRLQEASSSGWSVAAGLGWGFSFWVSLYEPLLLFVVALFCLLSARKYSLGTRSRRIEWLVLLGILLVAAAVERRCPAWPGAQPFFANWSATVGELRSLSLTNRIWLEWCGGLFLLAPLLLLVAIRRGKIPLTMIILLVAAFFLTLWEARWGYYLALLFVLAIPAQLDVVRQKWIAILVLALSLWPLLQFWDEQLWPNDKELARRVQNRHEAVEWRLAASSLGNAGHAAIMTPWWIAPATAYWSGQPVVAGSSHESLPGIVESARFFLTTSPAEAREILRRHEVRWVLTADGERVAENSAAILGRQGSPDALCRILDRWSSRAPIFLSLRGENAACKVYLFRDFQ